MAVNAVPGEKVYCHWNIDGTIISNVTLLFIVYLQGPIGLGFAIQEGNADSKTGIYIKTVTPDGPADQVRCVACLDELKVSV